MEEYIVVLEIAGLWQHVTVTEAELLNIGIRDSVEDKYGVGVDFKVYSVAKR